VRHGWVCNGAAGQARRGLIRPVRRGQAWPRLVGQGTVWQAGRARRGLIRQGSARIEEAWQARLEEVRAWFGELRQAGLGAVGRGKVNRGRVRSGKAGSAGPGLAGKGNVG
jgi:hypothetical protein